MVDNDVNLCGDGVSELCPIPEGSFSRQGTHAVPKKYTRKISAAAYNIPDLEGDAQITLFNASDPSQNLGCFQSAITNGKSTNLLSVRYLTLALAAVALVVAGVSSASSGNSGAAMAPGTGAVSGPHMIAPGTLEGGAGASKGALAAGNVAAPGFHPPSFTELFSAMQGIAVSGMYSVDYPSVYRSFTQNLGWSTGMITWQGMQTSIDTFRNHTGGNLTQSNFLLLQRTTLVYQNESSPKSASDLIPSYSSFSNSSMSSNSSVQESNLRYARQLIEHYKRQQALLPPEPTTAIHVDVVGGITAYVEKLTIPDTNAFMTLLIWYAIIVAVILTGILAFKLIVELKHLQHWKKHKKESSFFPDFRRSYRLVLMTMLVRLVIIFYGIWVLYSLFQFKIGDSWGTRLLAGLTLGIFSLVLLIFSGIIVYLAFMASKKKGGLEHLFEHEPWIRKYGVFYDQYKIRCWWFFIPILLATFGRNAFLALGGGNGLLQIVGQLVIEVLLMAAMAILMPFNTRWGNGINLAIQSVRVASLCLLLTFTKQINVSAIASTGVGFALLVIQALLTITLIVLLLISAVVGIVKAVKKQRQRGSPKSKNSEFEDNQIHLDEDPNLSRIVSGESGYRNEKDQVVVTSDSSPGATSSDSDQQGLRASVLGEMLPPQSRLKRHGRRLSHLSVGSFGVDAFTWEVDEGLNKGTPGYISIESPNSGSSSGKSSGEHSAYHSATQSGIHSRSDSPNYSPSSNLINPPTSNTRPGFF